MEMQDIAFATIGKDGKDDHCLTTGNETPCEEAPEIAFATIGKDGKDDTRLHLGDGEKPKSKAQALQL